MQLNIGILGDSPGWRLLLQQEGVPFSHVGEEISGNHFSVVVIGDSVDEREAEGVRGYLKNGGAVLCSARIFAQLAGSQYANMNVRYLLPEPDSEFEDAGLIDIRQKCRVPMNANTLKNERGATTCYVGEFLDGHVVALPFDIEAVMLDHRSAAKSFYSPTKRLPYEHVSVVSRGNVRRLIARALEILHHRRSMPYAHVWYYPRDSESVFSFRVDTDRGTEEEIQQLYSVAGQHRVPMSWFIDAKSQAKMMPVFKRMEHQELGVHCFDHRVYKEFERNLENIGKALEVMRLAGIEPKGFASPFGKWNKGLARAVKEHGLKYSSEFSYDYDNLPSTPYFEDKFLCVPQIPVHPICIGSLKRQGYKDARMVQYFENILRQKLASRLPLIFYHHPKDGHHSVLEHVFNFIAGRRVPMMRFADYVEWWQERQTMNLRLSYEGSHLKTSGRPTSRDVFLRITKGDGTEAL
ncbi:MAG: polysaccharide deacetylase family protein, partial [Bacteroidota bacterium]